MEEEKNTTEETTETEVETLEAEELEETERKPMDKVTKIAIVEALVLFIVLFICRAWIFPGMARVGEMHSIIALHSFMIGMTATLFSLFAITFRRVWKTHGKYVILPIIFTVFAFLMQTIVNEINF